MSIFAGTLFTVYISTAAASEFSFVYSNGDISKIVYLLSCNVQVCDVVQKRQSTLVTAASFCEMKCRKFS